MPQPSKKERAAAKETALRILSRRFHTVFELRGKLIRRGFAEADIESAISDCRRWGYLDDEKAAEIFFHELMRRGCGPRRMRAKMRKKGILSCSEALIQRFAESGEETACVRRVLEKEKRRFSRETDPGKRREKIYRFLCGRGFTPSVVRSLLE